MNIGKLMVMFVGILIGVNANGTEGTRYLVDGAVSTGRWDYLSICMSNTVTPRVFFSPNYDGPESDCKSNLIAEVNKAESTIYMDAYQFTLPELSDALIKAKKRGVKVRMIIDQTATNTRNEKVSICVSNKILVLIDTKHNIFHNKLMVIDSQTVITGSFNFTANAEFHNAENMWIIIDKPAAALCISNWMVHSSHSIPFPK